MVFIQGSYDIPTTIGLITQALVATDDFEMVDEEALDNHNHAGICIKHIPTSQYISFYTGYGRTCLPNRDTTGLKVVFSTAWNAETHGWDGTVYRGLVSIWNDDSSDITRLITPNVYSTSMWVDKYGVVGTFQNTYQGSGGMFSLEFFPQTWVEYDDGHQPIVLYTKRQNSGTDYGSDASGWGAMIGTDNHFGYLRPYRFFDSTAIGDNRGSYMEREAYRSEGNNKVYFKFPTYENGAVAARTAFAETRRWFRVSVTGGIQIGDILNWIDPDEVTVHKFIVVVAKGDSMYYAIPYENAFDYAVSAKQ